MSSSPGHPTDMSSDRCVPEDHCITCSDEGVPMRVAELAEEDLAICVDDDGGRSDVLIALIDDVRPGDLLLVHAGTALLRLERAEASA